MPRYYCDYCDTYLTHDSEWRLTRWPDCKPSVRKQHNAGYKHKANVRTYYQQFEEQQTQSLIDQRIKEHLGQAAAFQVGAAFNHLMQGPRLPVLRPPVLPIGASSQVPMVSPSIAGVRPPVLPRPVAGATGYMGVPPGPPTMVPPGATSMPMQMSSLPGPPAMPPTASGSMPTSVSNGAAPSANPVTYQANPMLTTSATSAPSASKDDFSYT